MPAIKYQLKDKTTTRVSSYKITIDKLDVMTISPNTIINMKLSSSIQNEINHLEDSHIFFHYKNFKQKNIDIQLDNKLSEKPD